MRRTTRIATAVSVLTAVAAMAGCGDAAAAVQVVPAMRVTLAGPAEPADRQLRLKVAMSPLADTTDPIDRVDVTRVPGELRLQVWVRERAPAAGEAVPNTAVVRDWTVDLDEPVGEAAVVDASRDPAQTIG